MTESVKKGNYMPICIDFFIVNSDISSQIHRVDMYRVIRIKTLVRE